MASTDPKTVFLAFIVILVVVIIILLGICWKVLKPELMRKLLRPKSPGSGEQIMAFQSFTVDDLILLLVPYF